MATFTAYPQTGFTPQPTTQQDPYSWSQILGYYKSPTTMGGSLYNVDTGLRPTAPQPYYSYAQMRYLQNKGMPPPPPQYTVQEPTAPLSAYANEILGEYNTRVKPKTAATYITDDILKNYMTNYNKANNLTAAGVRASMTPELQQQILSNPVYNPNNRTVIIDKVLERYLNDVNTGNDLTLAGIQGRIADEFNTSRQGQQTAYDTSAEAYRQALASPGAWTTDYMGKPVGATSSNPYLQRLYTAAGLANGGLVQDQFSGYNAPLRTIPPLSALGRR